MKNIFKNFIIANNELDWQKILLIYSTYDPKVPKYSWEGPIQYLRIGEKGYTGWNHFDSMSELLLSDYLIDYVEIPLQDFLNNY